MKLHDFLWTAAILLLVIGLATQVASRLRLGAVLGTLVAGVVLGPHGANLAHDVDRARSFTELGVVFLMFSIGLEMDIGKLTRLKRLVFGMGLLQIVISGSLIALLMFLLGGDYRVALIGGFGLSLSSTAIALKLLDDANERYTPHGEAAFATLLMQDLAVVPLLAIVPLLGSGDGGDHVSFATAAPKIAIALAVVIVGGRWILPFLLRQTLRFGNPPGFVAVTLLAVFAASLIMEWAALSMSLGAFLLGLQIRDDTIRRRIESVTVPATEIMLALFFVAVGMSIDLPLMRNHWLKIGGIVLAVMTIKVLVTYVLGRAFGLTSRGALRVAFLLAQAGEFCFVLFAAISATGLGRHNLFNIAVLGVSVSMALTPIVARLGGRWTRIPRLDSTPPEPA